MERGADPMTGRVLEGRYRVGAKIARGGMATVYEAHDLRLNRGCAVKIMHSDLGDDADFRRRFVREAHAAARLSHPNVVSVSDQGDDDGALFLVMEHVEGRTLRDVMREEAPMPPERALALLEPVLAALSEAHAAGLVHRDVKPENVLIADDGRIKVADFGLARAFDASVSQTATRGVLIGTVSYLAPELIVDGSADPRVDVYAAGVLLFEMLTGRKPHEGEGAIQIAFKHVNEDIVAPSTCTSQPLPSYVDALVTRATSREREHRQADAKVFLHQARRVAATLRAGVVEDEELTADLLPAGPTVLRGGREDGIDYVDEDTDRAVDRRSAGATGVAAFAPWVDAAPEEAPRRRAEEAADEQPRSAATTPLTTTSSSRPRGSTTTYRCRTARRPPPSSASVAWRGRAWPEPGPQPPDRAPRCRRPAALLPRARTWTAAPPIARTSPGPADPTAGAPGVRPTEPVRTVATHAAAYRDRAGSPRRPSRPPPVPAARRGVAARGAGSRCWWWSCC